MKNIIFVVLILILKTGMAQLSFKIENIVVSKIIEELGENVVVFEGFARGTEITIDCYIVNNSTDTAILYPSNFELNFTFENIKYSSSLCYYSTFLFVGIDSLIILPNQRFDFKFYDIAYLLGHVFYKWNKISLLNIRRIDHTKEVIATLPTLKVRYKDKNIDITTDEIKNVTVGDIPYIYK